MKNLKSILGILAILALPAGVAVGQTFVTQQPGSKVFNYQDKSESPGTIFWVDSATGTDSASRGRSPTSPFATVDYAIGKCTASKGDKIYVAVGHNEGGSAAIFDADVAGISIIGLGEGTNRPRFDFDNTAAIVSVGAANVTLRNLTFLPSVSAVVVGINIETAATNARIEGCEFLVGEAAGTDEFVSTIVVNIGANDATITGNTFRTDITDTHCTEAIGLGVGGAVARVEISDNKFYGNWSTAAIIDGTTAVTEVLISNNYMKVKNGEPGIELAAATTGLIVDNMIESTTVTCSAAIVAADGAWFNNYCVTTDGTAAVPIGLDSITDLSTTVGLIGDTVDQIETDLGLVGDTVDDIETALGLVGDTVDQIEIDVGLVGDTVDQIETDLTLVGNSVDDIATELTLVGNSVDDIATELTLVGNSVDDKLDTTGIGTTFMVSKALAHGAIVTGGADLTGTATGTVQLIDFVILNGSTVMDAAGGASNVELYTDNDQGSGDFWALADGSFVAGAVLSPAYAGGTDTGLPVILNGKKLKIKTSAFDETSDGNLTIYLIFRRLSAGATIAAS